MLQKKNLLSKIYMKNVTWKLVPDPFNFQGILCKKESKEV